MKSRCLGGLLCLLLVAPFVQAEEGTRLLRYPDIHGDQVGQVLPILFNGHRAVFSLGDHLPTGWLEDISQQVAHKKRIVNYQDTFCQFSLRYRCNAVQAGFVTGRDRAD